MYLLFNEKIWRNETLHSTIDWINWIRNKHLAEQIRKKKDINIKFAYLQKKKKQENYPRVKNFLLLERNASRKSKVGQKNIRHRDKISNIIIEVGEEQLLRSSLSLLAQSDFRSPD